MKLRNKKTGVIVDLVQGYIKDSYYGQKIEIKPLAISNKEGYMYNSLAELCAEWEDVPEEPAYYYFIQDDGRIGCDAVGPYNHKSKVEERKEIGNYFVTEEEAEKAVEKLRAWTRLKDKGFKFDGYDVAHKSNGNLAGQIFYDAGNYSIEDVEKEMDLIFGGEE